MIDFETLLKIQENTASAEIFLVEQARLGTAF